MQKNQYIYDKVLVLSDNKYIAEGFIKIIDKYQIPLSNFSFFCSKEDFIIDKIKFHKLSLKQNIDKIINEYNLLLSLHCLQIIPSQIVNSLKCINIHPGFNPYNKGWFPHVFSIINGLPSGASLHEIDEKIDNGPLINQKQVPVYPYDTSLSLYERIINAELELLDKNIINILSKNYNTIQVDGGNYNTKEDYEKLCYINKDEITTLGKAIDKLRALSHGDYKNAYFIDENTGNKIYVKIELFKDDEPSNK